MSYETDANKPLKAKREVKVEFDGCVWNFEIESFIPKHMIAAELGNLFHMFQGVKRCFTRSAAIKLGGVR